MAEQTFDLNNLVLDDNTVKILPDGDYHFMVDRHEIDYYSGNSQKIPANTQQFICYLSIPYIGEDGALKTATVRNTLNVYSKAMFAIRRFVECIGMVPEKGQAKINLDNVDGMAGVCSISSGTSAKGTEFNNADNFYPPSKAPAVCANDEAWKAMQAKDGFLNMPDGEEIPFA